MADDARRDAAPDAGGRTLLEEAISFLGHDVRDGHSSVLALLELQRFRGWPLPAEELGARVEQLARRALAAVDDFRLLATVREGPVAVEAIDWASLWNEAWADAWVAADKRGVRLVATAGPESIPGRGDREMLAIVFRKLLEEAIARTPSGGVLTASIAADGSELSITLAAGPGEPERTVRSPFGCRIVAAGAGRHGGRFAIDESSPERGVPLTLRLTL